MKSINIVLLSLFCVALLGGCQPQQQGKEPVEHGALAKRTQATGAETPDAQTAAEPTKTPDVATPNPADSPIEAQAPKLTRAEFNRLAVLQNLPLYWRDDSNGDGVADPDELATLLFYSSTATWTADGKLTDAYRAAFAALSAPPADESTLSQEEQERRKLVREDLNQGIPILVYNDLTKLSDADRKFAALMLEASEEIEELHAEQLGLNDAVKRIPASDPASRALFQRNWGPQCAAPKTEKNPACLAFLGAKKPPVNVYPAELQSDPEFCAKLEADPNAKELLSPFTAVVRDGAALKAVPYPQVYPQMAEVASLLKEAAAVMSDPSEAALKAYLEADAQAFLDNNWQPADEAWAKMNAENSKWYLRLAPDETYWEPCSQKAGFHMTLALINRDSIRWQQKIDPIKQKMEDTLAALAGAPYVAHPVGFHLPDFIDIVANAGDDRSPHGATIGQSLPNWGPVANEGRGRTVAMSNLYTDVDSLKTRRRQAETLFDATSLGAYTDSADPGLLATILHEAAHNLGPAHEYTVDGKTDNEVFGGQLAAVLEELKAQTAALWYTKLLVDDGVIDQKLSDETVSDSIFWAFGHVSRGMYDTDGRAKPYGQLAAIQLGFLLDEGALEFVPDAMAANGIDKGAFILHLDKTTAAFEKLMQRVAKLKATGDKADAEALVKAYVESDRVPMAFIAERLTRDPKASFVYAVEL